MSLGGTFKYDFTKDRLQEINNKLKCPSIWNDHKYIQKLDKERSSIENIINTYDQLSHSIKDITELFNLSIEDNDENTFKEIILELSEISSKLTNFELHCKFSGEHDKSNCYLDIQSGSGGTEAQDWAYMLMRMYIRWAENHGFQTEITDKLDGEIAGIKYVTIKIIGEYAYGWLRTETGVHRLVRKSPFDSSGKRHTSFSSVFIYPDIIDSISVEINPADLRIDVYRSSGAGGQHVNRTESAVRIMHIPTGIITQCQNNRSQHKNKDQAIKQMKKKLYELKIQKRNVEKKIIESSKSDITWGNQIRSYILDNSLIKDLRTGIESRNVQSVLNGDLDQFIEASINSKL